MKEKGNKRIMNRNLLSDLSCYIASDVILRKEYFGGIVFKITTSRYYEVNKIGYDILSYIYKNKTIKGFPNLEENKNEIERFIDVNRDKGIITNYSEPQKIKLFELEQPDILSAPCEAYLYLTNKCNQKCSFCYFKEYSGNNILTCHEWKTVVDELIDRGLCTLGFLGGEPLLEWETCLELLEYSNGRVHQTITTNGTANGGISKEQAKLLSKYTNLEINISIESYRDNIHNYLVGVNVHKNVMQSVINLVEAGVNVIIKTVALKANENEILDLAKWAKKVGVRGFYLVDYMPFFGESYSDFCNTIVRTNKYIEVIKELDKLKDKNFFILYNTRYRFLHEEKKISSQNILLKNTTFCSATGINMEIMPDGKVYTCPMVIGKDEYCIGNIKDGISSLWNSHKLDFFRKRDVKKLQDIKCIDCKSKEECVGGCPVVATIFGGNEYAGDPRCTKKEFTI